MTHDRRFLLRAIKIARDGIDRGSGPFGALIVKDGKVISEAVNMVVISSDPTAHAEIIAIREAASLLRSHDMTGCTLYCSCEPCPMCLGAVYWSGITKVVFACDRSDADGAGFSDKNIYDEIMLETSQRRISFLHIDDSEGKEVFREWERNENKIPY